MRVEERFLAVLAVSVVAVGLLASYILPDARGIAARAVATAAPERLDPVAFQKKMRGLWTDHVQWTFATVDAFFHNQEAVQAYLDRLLQNQQEIGAAFAPFYGKEAGDRLAGLLTIHIQQAVPVLQAAQAGDEAALQRALADWYANARDIAGFISDLNPNSWPQDDMRERWRVHIDQTTAYSLDLLNRNYAAAVTHFDEALGHMIRLADVLASRIIAQFPRRFAR